MDHVWGPIYLVDDGYDDSVVCLGGGVGMLGVVYDY